VNEKTPIFAATPQLRYPRLWFWFGVLLVASIILLSLISPPSTVSLSLFASDKISHAVAYGVLMGWFIQIFQNPVARLILGVMFIGLGVGLEFLQGLVPTRQFEVFDMAANAAGVVMAWLLASTFLGTILIWFERVALPRRAGSV